MAPTRFTALLLLASAALAQDPPASARSASISGTVRYAGSTAPVPEASVSVQGAEPVPTDSRGRYTIPDLPPGSYQLTVEKNGSRAFSRRVVLAGLDLSAVDINFRVNGTLSGRVLDERRTPVAGALVCAIIRVYSFGELQSRRVASATSDARGQYRLRNIPTNEPVLILASRFPEQIPGLSTVAEDIKDRAEVIADTYYPNAPVLDSAQSLTVRPWQSLDQLDIRMVKTRGYCAEGVMLAATAETAKLDFTLSRSESVSQRADSPGSTGNPAPGGQFRICNLPPGQYRLTTKAPEPTTRANFTFGITPFTVIDSDIRRLQVITPPLLSLSGDLSWEGADTPLPGVPPLTIRAIPLDRRAFTIDDWNEMHGVSATVPGPFRLPTLLMGDYELAVIGLPAGHYVKEVVYGGASILHRPLRLGEAPMNSPLSIRIARDGAMIATQVNDGDGKPVIDAYVYALPAAAETHAALAETLAWGQTDRFGQFTTDTLPPGKYYVVAVRTGIGLSAFGVSRLWDARLSQATELELGHGGFRQVRLTPVEIR